MPHLIRCIALICFFVPVAWILMVLIVWFPSTMSYTIINNINIPQHLTTDTGSTTDEEPFLLSTCIDPSLSVYVYTLPPRFNVDFLDRCRTIAATYTLCPSVANSGLGQPLFDDTPGKVTSWFNTMQFASELIFHARLLNHPCRTWDPTRASLFYVPFYGGLYYLNQFKESNSTARNQLAVDLANYIQAQPMWKRTIDKSAYNQYAWFLPEDASAYSVLIDEKSNASKKIEEELLKISSDRVQRMREKLIDLIRSLTYAHPIASNLGFEDVAVASLAKHVKHTIN
ncbi:hypothetical protein ACLB2K_001723 [Fragaria x ananassa]